MPREREEHVVERRSPKPDIIDHDALLAEVAHDLDELLGASHGRDRDPARVLVDRCRSVGCQQLGDPAEQRAVVHDDLDPLAADLALELVCCAAGDDLAGIDHGDLVGQLVGLLEILGREQQRRALAHLVADDLPHAEAAAGVEPGRRLVEEEQLRPADQRAREVEAPSHAARVRLRDPVGGAFEVERSQQLGCTLLGVGRAELVEAAEHPEVLAAGQVLVDGRVLAREADQLPHRLRVAGDVEPGDARAAGVGAEKRREDPDRGRLAGAVRPEQSQHRSLLHLEVDAVERAHLVLPGAVDLDEPLCFDHGHGTTLSTDRPSMLPWPWDARFGPTA